MLSGTIRNIIALVDQKLDARCYEQSGYQQVPDIEREACALLALIAVGDIPESARQEFLDQMVRLRGRFDFDLPGLRFSSTKPELSATFT